jgi:hypothetical protein
VVKYAIISLKNKISNAYILRQTVGISIGLLFLLIAAIITK